MIDAFSDEISGLSIQSISADRLCTIAKDINRKLKSIKSKKKDKLLGESIDALMDSIKEERIQNAIGFLRFILYGGFDNPIDEIRKKGAFRTSKYNYKTKALRFLISDIFFVNLINSKGLEYINNILNIIELSAEIRLLRSNIIEFIKSRSYFLKTALAIADMVYYDTNNYDISDEMSLTDSLFFRNKETILSSISFTLGLYKEVYANARMTKALLTDEEYSDDMYMECFYNAYLIQIFNDIEIKIDFFNYKAHKFNDNITIENYEFETALRRSYARSELRWLSIATNIMKNETIKEKIKMFSEFLSEFFSANDNSDDNLVYEIKESPVKRIVLKTLYTEYGHETNIFSHDRLFLEEAAMIETLCLENYNDEFLSIKLYKNFTAFDIIKIQRYFGYISNAFNYAYNDLLQKQTRDADLIRRRSVLPSCNIELLAIMLTSICNHPVDECREFIEMISFNLSHCDDHLDIQYHPILNIDGEMIFPPTILHKSNLIRSIAFIKKINLSTFNKKDHMIETINQALVNKGFHVNIDFKYGNDEIDVIAYLDGVLFIFECKNPYHPVSDFELRNTYSHLIKGFSQIEKFKSILGDTNSFNQLLTNARINPSDVSDIYYGVINANRVLSGLVNNNIKTFHANELINFIETGEITSNGNNINVWKSKEFDVSDLVGYIQGKNEFYNDLDKIKKDVYHEYKFKSKKLTILSCFFDTQSAAS
ncbi:TPA: hypothetical protein ACQZOI_000037 [Raoultella ornithinolytica]